MGLMDQIIQDVQQFTSNKNDFGVDLILISPTNVTKTVAGYFGDHSLAFDENGNPVTGRKVTVCVHEQSLIDAGYPSVRTANGAITMQGHFVQIKYPNGLILPFIVDFCQPDYTVNLITLFLVRHNG